MGKLGDHPVVHVAKGSHAIYRTRGKKERNNLPDDHAACSNNDRQLYVPFAEDDANREPYELRLMKNGGSFEDWTCWDGKWGPNGDSPKSPIVQDGLC